MARRSFGNLRQLPSGRWQARYQRDNAWFQAPDTFTTKDEARRWLTGIEADTLRGEWADPRSGQTLFATWAEAWQATRRNLAPKTRRFDTWALAHILPAFGAMRLDEITTLDIMHWHGALLGTTGRSVAPKCYKKLKAILDAAVQAGLIRSNPCTIKGAGQEHHRDMTIASPEQIGTVAAAVPDRYQALIYVAAYCSMRWGEIAGLVRSDISLERRSITVVAQDVEIGGTIARRQKPKTRAGRRTISIPGFVAEILAGHLAVYVKPDPDALVFTSSTGSHLRHSNFRRRVLKPAFTEAGLPETFVFHELRHTGATLAAAAPGVSTRELMERMGHSTMHTAVRYQHMVEGRDRAIADWLDKIGRPQ